MTRMQFALALALMGMMSLAGSFAAVMVLQSGNEVQAQDKAKAGTLRGSEIVLVDAEGNTRAMLDIGKDGEARFTLLDAAGKGRVQLNSGGDRAYMALLDQEQTVRYMVGQDKKGSVLQAFADSQGRHRMTQTLINDGDAQLTMFGEKGENYVTLLAGPKHASTLMLNDPTGKHAATLFAKDDQTSLSMNCGDGSILAAVMGDGRPLMAFNKDSKLRLRTMLDAEGTPEFIFLNEKREATWRAGK